MFNHKTVLLHETVDNLSVKEDGIYIDCTLGGAGHSEYLVKQLSTGHLYCFDQDQMALDNAKNKLTKYLDKVTFIKANFRDIAHEMAKCNIDKVDGIIYDLGVSSPQLDIPERGFSYQHDAILDMRMDQTSSLTALNVVNEWPYEDLVRIFYRYGEEKFSKQIARAIEKTRQNHTITTTFELVDIIKSAIPAAARRKGGHPAKRIFQAIRIAVNDELGAFEESLEQAIDLIKVGGRISVITFHSLEDRLCKQIFNSYEKQPDVPRGLPIIPTEYQPVLKKITRKPIEASHQELADNNRARSAKLRVTEKIREMTINDNN